MNFKHSQTQSIIPYLFYNIPPVWHSYINTTPSFLRQVSSGETLQQLLACLLHWCIITKARKLVPWQFLNKRARFILRPHLLDRWIYCPIHLTWKCYSYAVINSNEILAWTGFRIQVQDVTNRSIIIPTSKQTHKLGEFPLSWLDFYKNITLNARFFSI